MSIADLAAAPTYVGPDSNGMLLLPAEYDAIEDCDRGYRYELVNGVLVVLPLPGMGERSPNDELGYLLRSYRDNSPESSAFDGTAPEQTIECGGNRRRADRAIWVGLGDDFDPDRQIPTIAIEFVSASSRDWRRDYIEKRAEYAAAGVKEYWVIDRFEREMTVFRGEQVLVVAADGVYETPLLPGFTLPLAKLLERAERPSS